MYHILSLFSRDYVILAPSCASAPDADTSRGALTESCWWQDNGLTQAYTMASGLSRCLPHLHERQARPLTEHEQHKPHALPRWFEWMQDNFFLSALILAEAYLLGDLMQRGWVRDIEDPNSWGRYHGVGVVLFFAAGAMAAGVALSCSVKASNAFAHGKWGSGLFSFLGVAAFGLCEIWASLSERSANLMPTPADHAVLNLLGVSHLPISPTVVIVALLLPFTTLYSGFSRQHVETPLEEEKAKLERELTLEPLRQQVRARKAIGAVGLGRQMLDAARGKEPPEQPPTGPGSPSLAPVRGDDAGSSGDDPAQPAREVFPMEAPRQPRRKVAATVLRTPQRETVEALRETAAFALLDATPDMSVNALQDALHCRWETADKLRRKWIRKRHTATEAAQ